MKKKILMLSVSIFIFCGYTKSQIKFKTAIEAGISFNQFSKKKTEQLVIGTQQVSSRSIWSPVLGLHEQFVIINHVVLSAGLQYQQSGHSQRELLTLGKNSVMPGTIEDSKITQSYSKLGVPLSVGIRFPVVPLVFHATLSIGYRPCYYLSGKYSNESSSTNPANPSSTSFSQSVFNSNNNSYRLQQQVFVSASLLFFKHLDLGFSYYSGQKIQYIPVSMYVATLPGNDFVISLKAIF